MAPVQNDNNIHHGGNGDEEAIDSSDEALFEMLGLTPCDLPAVVDDVVLDESNDPLEEQQHRHQNGLPRLSQSQIMVTLLESKQHTNLKEIYHRDSVCFLPSELWISAVHMRRLTDELVWGGDKVQADRTYETIQVVVTSGQTTTTLSRRVLTRLENFVSHHKGWQQLTSYLGQCLSTLLNMEYVLYKEKLNLKPPGGSGFAPHLDTPSLRMAWSSMSKKEEEDEEAPTTMGPQTFVTVMVAIDDMRMDNGCLRICKGEWSESHHCPLIPPDSNGGPDAAGRAGAIPLHVANNLQYDDLICRGGAIAVFNGWAPHRSAPNASPFPRRAVFFTYNPKHEGDFHEEYYQRMTRMRKDWRNQQLEKLFDGKSSSSLAIDSCERDALATIPRI